MNDVFDATFRWKKQESEDIVADLTEVYNREKRKVAEGINHAKLHPVFAYIHFPDTFHHFSHYMTNQAVQDLYVDLDKFAALIRRHVPELVIVSDHGFNFDKKVHKQPGFYSSSFPINPEPKRITYFYHMMVRRTVLEKLSEGGMGGL